MKHHNMLPYRAWMAAALLAIGASADQEYCSSQNTGSGNSKGTSLLQRDTRTPAALLTSLLQVPIYTCRMASARINADRRTPSPSSRIRAASAPTTYHPTKNRLAAATKTALDTRLKSAVTPTQDYTAILHWTSRLLALPEPQAQATHSR